MKKIRYGLDIDGVLAEFGDHFLKYFNLPTHKESEWDDKRFTDNFHRCHNDKYFWDTIPNLGNVDVVKVMEPVIYVTARPIPNEWSMEWLWANGYPHAPVVTVGVDNSKVNALRGKVDIFVDDNYFNFADLNKNGILCLLKTRSHNEKYLVEDKRISNLSEALNYELKNIEV